eukprot:2128280-Pleurochrysis_carterae.AAC.1
MEINSVRRESPNYGAGIYPFGSAADPTRGFSGRRKICYVCLKNGVRIIATHVLVKDRCIAHDKARVLCARKCALPLERTKACACLHAGVHGRALGLADDAHRHARCPSG